jgi:hypothetical protein
MGSDVGAVRYASAARRVAKDTVLVDKAVSELERAVLTDATRATNVRKLRVITDLADQLGCVAFPMAGPALFKIAAVLKAAGYRSAQGHLDAWTSEHLRRGHDISSSLSWHIKQVSRALIRGIGPPSRAAVVDWTKCNWKAEVEADAFVIAMAWLLREAELRALRICDCAVDPEGRLATAFLAESKGDLRAEGVSRTVACSCWRDAGALWPPKRGCGPCAMGRQLARRSATQNSASGAQLFFHAGGIPLTKDGATNWWQAFGGADQNLTGHSARRTGAQRYAREGMSVENLKSLGRWRGNSVHIYIEEARAELGAVWTAEPGQLLDPDHVPIPVPRAAKKVQARPANKRKWARASGKAAADQSEALPPRGGAAAPPSEMDLSATAGKKRGGRPSGRAAKVQEGALPPKGGAVAPPLEMDLTAAATRALARRRIRSKTPCEVWPNQRVTRR